MGRLARVARVFVDSSVLFAGVRSDRGFARDLLAAGGTGRRELWVSRYVVAEVRVNLTRKAPASSLAFLDTLLDEGVLHLVVPALSLVRHVEVSIEPKDAPIVAAAITAGAAMLATYDQRHLLSRAAEIKALFGVEVLTPEEVLRRLGGGDP